MSYDTQILRGLIKAKGYTEGEVAKMIGLTPTTFSKKLNKKATFELEEAIKLSKILDAGLDAIFLQRATA